MCLVLADSAGRWALASTERTPELTTIRYVYLLAIAFNDHGTNGVKVCQCHGGLEMVHGSGLCPKGELAQRKLASWWI